MKQFSMSAAEGDCAAAALWGCLGRLLGLRSGTVSYSAGQKKANSECEAISGDLLQLVARSKVRMRDMRRRTWRVGDGAAYEATTAECPIRISSIEHKVKGSGSRPRRRRCGGGQVGRGLGALKILEMEIAERKVPNGGLRSTNLILLLITTHHPSCPGSEFAWPVELQLRLLDITYAAIGFQAHRVVPHLPAGGRSIAEYSPVLHQCPTHRTYPSGNRPLEPNK